MPRSSTKKRKTDDGTYERFLSQLKPFEVVDLDDDGVWGTLRCPKKDCKGEFKVKRKQFKECRPQIGRSCPYCFRTSLKPGIEEATPAGMHGEQGEG